MTEQQAYRVLQTRDGVELREYAECVVADVVVPGNAERAGNSAFGPLFSYISGRNGASTSLAMTAPVIQEAASDERWIVSFVLPGSRPIDEYPAPSDERVSLRAIPSETAAALRWSGRWTSGNVAEQTMRLRRVIESAGWQATGDPRWARFDPPWKPAFLRRNEIVVPVRVEG